MIRDGDQLDLWEAELVALPWKGQSPRALTRAANGLFLRQEPPKSMREFVDGDQLDLFDVANQRGPLYEGAPSLFLLPRRS